MSDGNSEPETRQAVAVAVRRADGLVLAVRRPDEPGEDLPGIWGLPAATLRAGETPDGAVRRLGREKLGVELAPLARARSGAQPREGYTLHMTLYEAATSGTPRLAARIANAAETLYEAVDWLPVSAFQEAAGKGSLCCRLLLEAEGP